MGHVFVFGEPAAGCIRISAPCLGVCVPFVWCSVCHCLEVRFACLPYVVLCAPLAGCVWCLYGPWPMCPCCWSAVLWAVSHFLDVVVACMLRLHAQCAIYHRWCPHELPGCVCCLCLCFMVLSEGVCCVLCLLWAGYMCILCFLYLP